MSDPRDEDVAIADPIVRTQSRPKPKREAQGDDNRRDDAPPPYNVILVDDDCHTFPYVIEMLTDLFRHSTETAQAMADEVNSRGRVIVFTTHKELAELKRDQVLAYGPDPRSSKESTGSMRCYIEPAPAA